MSPRSFFASILICAASTQALAQSAEVCGNAIDDDADGFADESCYPGLTAGMIDSPLSTADVGMISPSTGSLRYQVPPDVAPKVPWGPSLAFRRTYASKIDPGASPPAYKKPMGDRWTHNFMGWLQDNGSSLVIRLPTGQDIVATGGAGVWETHGGQATKPIVQNPPGPMEPYTITMLDGSSLRYKRQYAGGPIVLDRISNVVGSLTIQYNVSDQISQVSDASGNRVLVFGYTGSLLTSVQLQVASTPYHTTSYAYTGNNLTSVTIGGQLAQTNVYTSNYLTQIQDGAAKPIVTFAYDSATPGKAVRVDSARGTVGFEFNSAVRPDCAAGKTILYFNRGNTLSCGTDANCGAGFLCGGKTGAGSTGQCFRAGRCLTVDTTAGHHEDLVTSVSSVGPPGELCEGACRDVAQYLWDNSTRYVASLGTQDPAANYTVRELNTNGLPTRITFGDPDSNATNGNAAREVYLKYTDVNFPGRVTEIRRKSNLHPDASTCSPTLQDACQITSITWNATTGKPASVNEWGWTLEAGGFQQLFNFTTSFSYDAQARITQIDGPLAGSNDVTVFEYWNDPARPLEHLMLQNFKRKKDATTFLTTSALAYDFWGNPTALQSEDGSVTCMTFSDSRGFLRERREAMAGQTDCATFNAADISAGWARDSALRLTQVTRPDGSCMFYEYGNTEATRPAHLLRTKRRDDCNAASTGDRQEFLYDSEGLVKEIQTLDAASVITAKQLFEYFDSRKLQKIVNPVDVSKWTGLAYDARGLLSQVDAAGGLGKTVFNRVGLPGADGRVTSVDRYKTSSAFDTWNLLYDWIGNQLRVTDGDAKATETVRDDLGRVVKIVSPDMSFPTLRIHDNASRLITIVEAFGGGGAQQTHQFTYDNVGRLLDADYHGTCDPTGGQQIEIRRRYDSLPTAEGATCPAGVGCNRINGRLAYVKAGLMCTATQADNSLDQETFYSYDDAGRMIREYIRDDVAPPNQRIADHQYEWTKNGALSKFTTPSAAIIGSTFDSTGNSDKDLVSAVWRTSIATPVVNAITWFPYGPLKQFNQQHKIGNKLQRTRITRNLAYRTTATFLEPQAGGAANFSVTIGEDAKGRVIKRDYAAAATGVQDSHYLYDDQDRVLCENATLVGSCPLTGADLKNNQAGGFTNAGDWKKILRPIAGSSGCLPNPPGTCFSNEFNPLGYGTSHQVAVVRQNEGTSPPGDTEFHYGARGNRIDENATNLTNDRRDYGYDARGNVITVQGKYFTGGVWHDYTVTSAFDAQSRRVFKSFLDNNTGVQAQWFFYYDADDRLSEIRHTPNIAAPTTFSLYQLIWIDDRLTLYWQTDFASGTTTKRYVDTDESERPIEMWTWPASGNGTRVWAVNPSAWGFDKNVVGPTVFQPILFAGQYQDTETIALTNSGSTVHRPGLALNGFRTYDPFTGGYLQVDARSDQTWLSYTYADSDPVGKSDPTGLEEECNNCPTIGNENINVSGVAPVIDTVGNNCAKNWWDCLPEPPSPWDHPNGCLFGLCVPDPPGGDSGGPQDPNFIWWCEGSCNQCQTAHEKRCYKYDYMPGASGPLWPDAGTLSCLSQLQRHYFGSCMNHCLGGGNIHAAPVGGYCPSFGISAVPLPIRT